MNYQDRWWLLGMYTGVIFPDHQHGPDLSSACASLPSISGEPPRNRQSRAKKPRHRGPMPGFPSGGEQRKEPNSILICGLSASPVSSLRSFSTFSTESPEAQCPWNGHFLRQLAAFPAPGSSPCFETVALLKDHYRLTRPRRRLRARISRRQPLAYPNDLQRLPFAASRSRNSARTINFAHPDLAVLSHLLELVTSADYLAAACL